ncbi:MAG: IclR family transcriptional regulator [Anaerolineae bacterium]|nr:IclR family transcriptional regulator [Anaerolineae bacterium]
MDRAPETYNVRAVERAMQILSSFDGRNSVLGVSEVAQATGLPKATTHRILMTLCNGEFLERAGDGERFRLGLRMVELGMGALRGLDFRRAAFPYMQQLVERFQEICTLAIFDRGRMLYVEVVHSERSLTIAARVGRHLPAHCTASGKVFLAFLPPQVVDPLLNAPLTAYTGRTITSPEQLRKELEEVQQRGYAVADEEFEVGIRAISAPIRNIEGEVIAAISIPFPVNRLRRERIPEIAHALVEAAHAVSAYEGATIVR